MNGFRELKIKMLESCTVDDKIIVWFPPDKGKRKNSESEINL